MIRMPSVRHQTTVLARGRHRSAEHGVCAMELSSMLGDERFTDHPQRVCPAIAAFLRGYNDALPAHLRVARRRRLPWPPTFTPENAFGDLEEAGAYVGRLARRDRGVHERTVAFVEALVQSVPEPTPPAAELPVLPTAPDALASGA